MTYRTATDQEPSGLSARPARSGAGEPADGAAGGSDRPAVAVAGAGAGVAGDRRAHRRPARGAAFPLHGRADLRYGCRATLTGQGLPPLETAVRLLRTARWEGDRHGVQAFSELIDQILNAARDRRTNSAPGTPTASSRKATKTPTTHCVSGRTSSTSPRSPPGRTPAAWRTRPASPRTRPPPRPSRPPWPRPASAASASNGFPTGMAESATSARTCAADLVRRVPGGAADMRPGREPVMAPHTTKGRSARPGVTSTGATDPANRSSLFLTCPRESWS